MTSLVFAVLPSLVGTLLQAHPPTTALAIARGVEWELLDQAGRKEMTSAAMGEKKRRVALKKRVAVCCGVLQCVAEEASRTQETCCSVL